MKILFINLSNLRFNVMTPDSEPLGGSESSVCYLAREMARVGHDVSLVARPPSELVPQVAGVAHYPPEVIKEQDFFDAKNFEAIIVCNAPMIFEYLKEVSPQSFNILWCHMLPDQPAMQELPKYQYFIDCVVYVANGQRQAHGLSGKSHVIGNGMAPAFENMFASAKDLLGAKQNLAVYTSTPFRGLNMLPGVWARLTRGTRLDVYSSMKVYQDNGEGFAPLYDILNQNPLIKCHGSVSQAELAKRLRPAAFFAYPCIFAECYSIAVLEAQAAGVKIITTDYGSLRESTMGFADLMPAKPGNGTMEEFVATFHQMMGQNIEQFLSRPEEWAEQMFEQVQTVNRLCPWGVRAREWEQFLRSECRTVDQPSSRVATMQ